MRAPHPIGCNPSGATPFREFESLGFPTTRDEDWKYTNVAPIARQRFTLARAGDYAGSSISSLDLPGLRFVGGKYASSVGLEDDAGPFEVTSLARAIRVFPKAIEAHLSGNPAHVSNGFVALNRAFLEDGGFIRVPAGANVSTPMLLSFLAEQAPTPSMAHPATSSSSKRAPPQRFSSTTPAAKVSA